MASKVSGKHSKMALWIPSGMDPNDKTFEIANRMKTKFKMIEIDKDDYNDNFQNFYEYNLKGINDDVNAESFCKSKGKVGVNMHYLIENANKRTFVTLMLVKYDHFSDSFIEVDAIVIFRWTKTANALKIQVLCADQRKKGAGGGTKLLNTIKTTLSEMGLNNIYLNPIDVAVPYYHKQNFRTTLNPDKIIHDSSDPKIKTPTPKLKSKTKSPKSKTKSPKSKTKSPKSKTKSKTKSPKSKTKSKPRSRTPSPIYSSPIPGHISSTKLNAVKVVRPKENIIPSMTMNIRARNNWNKTKTKFKAMSVLKENINKSRSKRPSPYKFASKSEHHSSQDSPKTARQKKMLLKIDEIINNLSRDAREMATFDDIELIIEKEIKNYNNANDGDLVMRYIADKYNIENY